MRLRMLFALVAVAAEVAWCVAWFNLAEFCRRTTKDRMGPLACNSQRAEQVIAALPTTFAHPFQNLRRAKPTDHRRSRVFSGRSRGALGD